MHILNNIKDLKFINFFRLIYIYCWFCKEGNKTSPINLLIIELILYISKLPNKTKNIV